MSNRALASIFATALVAVACSSAPAGGGGNQTPAGGNPNPPAGGATTFHVVVADGPKAGTYDLSTTDPGACSSADVGYFSTDYLETSNPGLDFLEASLHPGNKTGLAYAFDADTDNKVLFNGTGTVTFDLNDGGTTATVHVVSDKNFASSDNPPLSTETGKVDITIQCASVLRPNPQ